MFHASTFHVFLFIFLHFQGGGGDQMSVAALAGLFMMLIGGMVRQSSPSCDGLADGYRDDNLE